MDVKVSNSYLRLSGSRGKVVTHILEVSGRN